MTRTRPASVVLLIIAGAIAAQAATVTLTNSDAFGLSSFDTGLNWSDGLAPSAANDYFVVAPGTNVLQMRTPAVAGDQTFAGNSLTLGGGTSGGNLLYKGMGGTDVISIANLTLDNGSLVNGQTPTNPFIVAGNITLAAGGGLFDQGAAGRAILVTAPVGGPGGALVYNPAGGAGLVTFASNNTYAGPTTIATGTLVIGTGGPAGTLGGGPVTNRGTLVFHRSDSYTVTNPISGALGGLLVRGGDLTLLDTGATNLLVYVADPAGPVSNTTLNISNSTIAAQTAGINSFNVGGVANTLATGIVNLSGGQLVVSGELWVATGAGSSRGIFNLNDGQVKVSSWTAIGRGSSGIDNYGELNIYGGSWSNVLLNNISVASFLDNTGLVRVAGGRLYAQNGIFVGESGSGFLQVGNTGEVDANVLTIGDRNTGGGAAVITGGLVQARTSLGVANGATTTGSLDMSAGRLRANAITSAGTATINLSGGQLGPYNATAGFSVPMTLTTTSPYGGDGTVNFNAQMVAGPAADINQHAVLSGDGSVVKTGPGALNLNGANTYSGPTTVGAGYLFGTGSVVSAVTVSNGAFLGPNSLLFIGSFVVVAPVTLENGAGLSAFLNGGTPSLVIGGALTANGSHPVRLLPTFTPVTPGTNTLATYVSLSAFNFTTGSLPAGVQGYLQDNPTAQTIEFVVTNVTAGAGLVWSGASDNLWDVQTTTNWLVAGSSTPALFNHGDSVRFDDTGTNTAVVIPVAVTPGTVTVSNNAAAYAFSGSGIIGSSTITKQGTASLLVNMASAHTGTNLILGGTLVASNATALGATGGPTVINGGTLDTGGQDLGGEPVLVSGAGVGGNGAIVNNGPGNTVGLQYVTLAGDTTFGGPNRWDIRNNNATLDLAGFTLTKTGANYIALANTMTATNAGDFVINSGTLAFEFAGSTFSGPGSIVVNPGGTMGLYQAANIWKTNVYNGGTVLSIAGGGTNQIGAPVLLNTNTTINSTGGDMSYTNVLSGPAGFIKLAANNVILVATNTYEGATVISAGGVMVGNVDNPNGTLGGGNVTNNGQLIFNRPDSHVVTNRITGSGQLLARRGETTLLNTTVTNTRLYVLDTYIPDGNAILHISNSVLDIKATGGNNCSIGLSTNMATTGIVNMVSGALRATNELWIAAGGGSSRGVINLLGGDIQVHSWTAVGRGNGGSGLNNYGELNISGGTWSNIGPNHISIASFANNTGRVSLSNGRLFAQNSIYVAEGGYGYLTVSGGVVDPNILSLGQVGNGVGRMDLSGGTVVTRNVLTVANAAGSVGTIWQTGGSLTATGSDSRFANNATAYAFMRASGGTFTTLGNFQVGATGVGILEVEGTSAVAANAGFPVVGRFTGGRGVLHVAGGSYTHNNSGSFLIIGEQGYAVLNVGGSGTVTVHSARTGDGLRLGHVGGTGIVNIAAGGVVVAPAVTRGTSPGTLNFHGGTLRANNSNGAFLPNLSAAYIHAGGAQLDDGGFALTIGQALLAPAGNGLVSIPVLTGGDGYKGPPFVQIVGGGGGNATAIAQLDTASGSLTNILVTNPGTGYTNFPAITLVGGSPDTTATLGTPVFAANTSGGLTKLGAGSVTLTASNSYAGATLVGNGTLLLTGTGSFANSPLVSIQTGATLDVSGRVDGTLTLGASRTLGGGGTVNGAVVNDGAVSPGFSAGMLTVSGTFAQTNGALNIELGGATGPGVDYDQLAVGGAVTFGGALNVSFINAYTGAVGDIFVVVAGSSGGSGTFATTNLPALGAGRGWNLQYLGGAVVLSVTGAPTATGYDAYALQITNAAERGYANDPDGDGYANLLEYATGGDPTVADQAARLSAARSNAVFTLRFTRATNAVDATLLVEGGYAATNDTAWLDIAVNSNGLWTGAAVVTETGSGSPVNVAVEDTDPAATNRFLRLRVTRP